MEPGGDSPVCAETYQSVILPGVRNIPGGDTSGRTGAYQAVKHPAAREHTRR
ncbi:hypothetical protein DPMN_139608 [Dreissena polymorpha]|uniref:Uncharacterized protein n=1 Tax=Dreissena polymorpha TaxID=45954 RepID=A0A9D4GBY6_DREPO|nr:hypothetical protein DPMN_139608 [Dreissena polymorpha]